MTSLVRLIGLAAVLVVGLTGSALAERRVALVIGNGAYQNAPTLPNPPRDAHAMADKLKLMGFQVVEGYDLNKETLNSTIQQFARSVVGADVGLFYYAGHGMQVRGENYIVPIDARLNDDLSIDFEITKASFVIDQMSRDVKLKVALLDACRDNPLSRSLAKRSRSNAVVAGMAEMKMVNQSASEGSLIAFATDPGDVAEDGTGEHSPFTEALLENLDAPVSLSSVMNRVTSSVLKQTDNRQRPWVQASLTGDVFLNPAAASDAPAPVALTPPAATVPAVAAAPVTGNGDNAVLQARETALWDAVKEANTVDDYHSYLQTYPTGLYSGLAQNAIKRLTAQQAAANPPPAAPAPAAAPTAPQPGQPQQMAALQPNVRAAPAFGTVQDVTQAASSAVTEAELTLDAATMRGIQQRLKLAGFYKGRPDGNFGAGSRVALTNWQTARGIGATGYLNQPQYALLLSETDAAYNVWKQQQAAAAAARPKVVRRQVVQDGEPVQPRPRGGGGTGFDPGGAAFIGGLMGGVLGGVIANH